MDEMIIELNSLTEEIRNLVGADVCIIICLLGIAVLYALDKWGKRKNDTRNN